MRLDPLSQPLDEAASIFAEVRPRLFGIAYRILGSAADAEDVVQEVWLRWQLYDRSAVVNAPAFLATTATRMAINVATSARSRRETYVGPWLPEPVDTSADPELGAVRAEALELAILLLLEKLTPTERAAYVLREAFDYPYPQIADIVGVQEANARQLVSRARKHIAEQRGESVATGEQSRLLSAFLEAAQGGDLAALEELFAADVVSYSDGGGLPRIARIPVAGSAPVAKFILAWSDRFFTGATITWIEVNGQVAARVDHGDSLTGILALHATVEGIDQLMWMMNPAKLGQLA